MYRSSVEGKGGISAKVVEDSTANGVRLITMELCYHRFIHGELMTHRVFSRNASSSRAIPVAKMMEQVDSNPATPLHWGKNQPGMQAQVENVDGSGNLAFVDDMPPKEVWKIAATYSTVIAESFSEANYHKQIVNRLLEPFQFIKVVVTATEWHNFFCLRDHKDAQPEIRELARVMKQAQEESSPEVLEAWEWHLPYVSTEELLEYGLDVAVKCSAARCARVSYLNHDNSSPSVDKDLELFNMLASRPYDDGKGHVLGEDDPVHMSPLEHQARPIQEYRSFPSPGHLWEVGITHQSRDGEYWSGNFRSWIQHRQM